MSLEAQLAALIAQVADLAVAVRELQARVPAPLLSVADAARHLGLSVVTVRRMVHDHRIPFKRVGRRILVDVSAVVPLRPDEVEALALRAVR